MFATTKKRQPSPAERFDALGVAIAEKRDEAVKARKESGIEDVWRKCEESYHGIDDQNRHEFQKAKWCKPATMEAPVTENTPSQDDTRSTAFVRLTSRYVDFAAARICEITLPIDDKAFSFETTPLPELVNGQLAEMQNQPPAQPMAQPPLQAPMQVPEQAMPQSSMVAMMGGGDQAANEQPEEDPLQKLIEKAKEQADKAETRIYDWMVETRYPVQTRKVVHDSARIGTGVLKGPFPGFKKSQAISRKNNVIELQIVNKKVPKLEQVDPWNIFPDPACGEDIHEGDYIFERDYFSRKSLRKLKGRKGWNNAQIDKVIKEGPGKAYVEDDSDENKAKKHRYEVWHYYGTLCRDDLAAAGIEKLPDDCEEAYAIVTLINDSVVRCVLNPLDSGEFPYHVLPWTRRAGHWAGVGVAEQIEMPQRMVNAGTRALLNNAGKAAGVQIVLDRSNILPENGRWEIVPDKVWVTAPDAVIEDVRKAFHIFKYPSLQNELQAVIEYGMRLAEEHSSIPLISQGYYHEGGSPQTLGQAELQNNNAQALLRHIGNSLDDFITEPVVNMLYEWLLLDPDVPDDEKGDFNINAHGSLAMVERAIQEMTLIQALNMATNPAYGADPKKVYAMWLKSKRLNPRDVQYTDEELEQMSQNQPGDPRIEAAKIAAQSRIDAANISAGAGVQKENIKGGVAMERARMDTDRDLIYAEGVRERNYNDAMLGIEELKLRKELAILEYANRHNETIEKINADLARDKMKLDVQERLAGADGKAPQVATPPTEPAGRAPDGEAYQR